MQTSPNHYIRFRIPSHRAQSRSIFSLNDEVFECYILRIEQKMIGIKKMIFVLATWMLYSNAVEGFSGERMGSRLGWMLSQRFQTLSNPRAESSMSMVNYDEESEWYVPPADEKEKKVNAVPKLPPNAVPEIRVIESKDQLQEFLNQDDRLCLVKFHATWCKSCLRFGLHLDKLAAQKADWVDRRTGQVIQRNQIRIASVEWSQAESLCQSLGITKLPTVQFYARGRKLTEVSAGASNFVKIRDVVDQLSIFSPQELDFVAQMEDGASMIQANLIKSAKSPLLPEGSTDTSQNAATLEVSAVDGPFSAVENPAPVRRWWLQK